MPVLLTPDRIHPDADRHRSPATGLGAAPGLGPAPGTGPATGISPAGAPPGCDAVPFVLVGGLPGSGKTTLLRRAAVRRPRVRVLDPERYRDRFAVAAGGRLPYRSYRPLVHGLHAAQVLGRLLAGPRDGRPLLVHEPATRPRRNAALAALARARGWRPVLLVLDVEPEQALAGQQARGRVLREGSFRGHCERWTAGDWGAGRWDAVRLVDRQLAEQELDRLLR